jgi:hypothetical protein
MFERCKCSGDSSIYQDVNLAVWRCGRCGLVTQTWEEVEDSRYPQYGNRVEPQKEDPKPKRDSLTARFAYLDYEEPDEADIP